MTLTTKIEQLEISLRGFIISTPEDQKNIDFKERMIREISQQLTEFKGSTIDLKPENE